MDFAPFIIIILILSLFVFRSYRNRNVQRITVAAARERAKDRSTIFLDVRTDVEVRRDKMKGAVSIPLYELRDRLREMERYRSYEIIVVCATGSRSVAATRILRNDGFNAFSMIGGLRVWRGDSRR